MTGVGSVVDEAQMM